MRLYPEKLSGHLQKELLPVYLVSGEETLLVQECCDAVRAAARAAGCTEREIVDSEAPGFDWGQLAGNAASMSLFGDRKLVELRLPSGKPGAEGSKALQEYLELSAGGDDILLIIAGKIDKQSTNSKWYKALDQAGATLQLWPVKASELPRWLQQRLRDAGLEIDRDALELLSDRVEGNLLAAVQEVEKLKLLADGGRVSVTTVTEAVSDNARYNIFDMADSALAGNAADSVKMLRGLRAEGTEATIALWSLLKDIRTLQQARTAVDAGKRPQQALADLRVFKNRLGLMHSALERHPRGSLIRLMTRAAATDGAIKGFADGKPWDQLENLVLALAGRG